MMKHALVIVMCTGFGCSVGGGGGGTGGDDDPVRPDAPIVTSSKYCEQTYKLTGTWTAGTPTRDADTPTGCWPVGTWVFSAAIDTTREVGDYNNDGKADRCGEHPGSANPMIASSYSFRVNRTDDGSGYVDSYTYLGTHMAPERRIEVSGDGGGKCEGDLLLVDGDHEWQFKAAQTATVIAGFAEYKFGVKPGSF